VIWSSDKDTYYAKAMATQPSFPWHCGVVLGAPAPNNLLFLLAHQRGGNFLQSANGGSQDSDWRLTFDDYLPNKDVASFWYGYHEDYVLTSEANPTPESGRVRGYTNSRVVRLIDWAIENFPVDPARTYAFGHSMGGSFGVFLALTAGDRVAAVWSNVAKVDLSDFRRSILYPEMFEPMWGQAQVDLPTDQGINVYERLRAASLAGMTGSREVAPIISFSGRADETVGWPEKVPFYLAMEANHHGGRYFWDQREHSGPGGMDLEGSVTELFRFRRDRSWPALSNASCNDDPGNGEPAVGDSIGSINGCVDWDDNLVDYADRWEVLLKPRAITTLSGVIPAPSYLTVDVSPKRLQNFIVHPGTLLAWEAKRMSDGEEVVAGEVMVDANRRIIVTEVPVYEGGTRLRIHLPGVAGVGGTVSHRPLLSIDRTVVRGSASLSVAWPGFGDTQLGLFDVSGRRIRTLYKGPAHGQKRITVDTQAMSAGVYFVRALQGGESASLRFVVVH
jgi:pimeloyl-ACP methyl ester carboxylesterase